MNNILTIDTEYWWSNEYIRSRYNCESFKPKINDSIDIILRILEQYNVTATFFILGVLVENNPEVVEEIYDSGHEIGCHCYSHKMINHMSRHEFEDELCRSNHLLQKYSPKGFRAPCFSINESNSWTLDIIKKGGYTYDSSIFPLKTPLYGVKDAPTKPYFIDSSDIKSNQQTGTSGLIEFPISPFSFLNIRIPFSGGFYFRTIPINVIELFLKKLNRNQPCIFYLHPWEFDSNITKLDLNFFGQIVSYYGIKNNIKKLSHLLSNYKFTSCEAVLSEVI